MNSPQRRIVLFSGGSASNALACSLEQTGAEIVHVIAVFDNGGSAGVLRRFSAQPFPAVGDIRKRLLALAPSATEAQAAIKKLFDARLALNRTEQQQAGSSRTIAALVSTAPISVRNEVLDSLNYAIAALPSDLSFHDLSVGNLLMFGRTLQTGDCLEAIAWARKLLGVRSQVLPVTLDSVHLGAQCEGGHWVPGQAALTNHSVAFPGRVERLCLLRQEDTHEFPATATLCTPVADALAGADALVLGFGSFLTSILPHFLVQGVGAAFIHNKIPRLFLINPTADKETCQFTVASMLEMISQYALEDNSATESATAITDVLHFGPDSKIRIPAGEISFLPVRYRDLANVQPLDEISRCASEIIAASAGLQTKAISQRSASPRPVVLFDLDATLFDYPRLRIEATAAALEGMVHDPAGISRDLFELLRQAFADVLAGFGLPNLRRSWDSPDVLILASLLNDPAGRKGLLELSEIARASVSSEEDVSLTRRILAHQRAIHLRDKKDVSALLGKIAEARQQLNTTIGEKTARFHRYVEANARLNPGAAGLINDSLASGAEVHVVSEGDFAIQRFKFDSLKLANLARSCIVTDVTCGILPLLDELFLLHKDSPVDQIPPAALKLYHQLAQLTIKSQAFYTKLLHGLRESDAGNLEDSMKSPHFLTAKEWDGGSPFHLVMVGDRYRKDLEPLLQVCQAGLHSFRLMTGRYSREDTLDDINSRQRPAPTACVKDLISLKAPLAAALRDSRESVQRPIPSLPSPAIIREVLEAFPEISDQSKKILCQLEQESLRHHPGK